MQNSINEDLEDKIIESLNFVKSYISFVSEDLDFDFKDKISQSVFSKVQFPSLKPWYGKDEYMLGVEYYNNGFSCVLFFLFNTTIDDYVIIVDFVNDKIFYPFLKSKNKYDESLRLDKDITFTYNDGKFIVKNFAKYLNKMYNVDCFDSEKEEICYFIFFVKTKIMTRYNRKKISDIDHMFLIGQQKDDVFVCVKVKDNLVDYFEEDSIKN